MTQSEDGSAGRIEVDAPRVEAVIPLDDIVGRIQQRATAEAASLREAAGDVSQERTQRLDRISQLASELAQELSRLEEDEPG